MRECNRIRNLFGPYIYDNVTPTERSDIENHISKCRECAEDLFSRQRVLGIFRPQEEIGEMPQRTQDELALNVYRKIALDSLKRQSQHLFLQRFILQPSLAVFIVAFGIITFFLRFHPGQIPSMAKKATTVVVNPVESSKKELRESLYVEEFFTRQGTTYEDELKSVKTSQTKGKIPDDKTLPLDTSSFVKSILTPDSRSLLEEANFIHFSLGDRKRALAQYQKLVENYPDTEAAGEALEMINSIRASEYRAQNDKTDSIKTIDLEI